MILPGSGTVFSVPHLVAEIFLAEERIVSLVNRSSHRQEVEIYMDSWGSRVNEPIGSDYFEDVLQKGRGSFNFHRSAKM